MHVPALNLQKSLARLCRLDFGSFWPLFRCRREPVFPPRHPGPDWDAGIVLAAGAAAASLEESKNHSGRPRP
jgi:hypothetical protein